jgi:hypothetical protein
MKKIKNSLLRSLVVTVGLLNCSLESIAQTESANKIIVNFGGGAVPEIIEETNDLADALFSDGTRTSETAFSGTFSIQYDRVIAEKYSVGVSFIFEELTKDVTITGSSSITNNEAYKGKHYTVLVNGSYMYSVKPKFEMYARLGLGVSFTEEKYTEQQVETSDEDVLFAYQISPIGIRVGQKLFFQAEAGFGYVGILSIGVGYRF